VTGEVLCYVYAIVDASAPPLEAVPGVDGTDLHTVEVSELAAVVSLVDRGRFNAESLQAALADLGRLEQIARAHHRVIETIARQTPVAPLRMATILWDEPGVVALLEANRSSFTQVLERIRGREEWGVKAYAAPESEVAALNAVQAIHAGLTAKATDTRLHPPQSAQLSRLRQPMLLNAAYLLDAADGVTFTAAVAGQATAHPELRIELSGPWPPYSFAGDDEGATG